MPATKTKAKRRPGRPPLQPKEAETAQPMTAAAFRAWLAAEGLTDSQAARRLGMNRATVGRLREQGGTALLGLACAAVSAGLASWVPARKKARKSR